ncbi:MAG: outer membrane lipoprotein chaperone LolA [Chitinophagaceae bacterium]
MKKIYALLVTAFAFFQISWAQKDPAAKAVLDRVSSNIKNSKGATANFSYAVKNRKGESQGAAQGKLVVSGNRYHITQGDNEIISNGATLWNYDQSANEVNVSTPSASGAGINPDKLLTGSFSATDFNYKLVSQSGGQCHILLTPTDLRKNFKQIDLYVDKSRNMISKASVLDKSGNTTFFQLSNIKTNVAVDASQFEFNKAAHPGVEVID